MADYSGHYDPCSTSFDPKTGPNYWWSHKDFSGTVKTTVPEDYLGFLQDVWREYCRRNNLTVSKPRIVFDAKRRNWVLEGYALSWGNRQTERYFGWENPCPHDNKHMTPRGYEWCHRCDTIFCEHPKTRDNLVQHF